MRRDARTSPRRGPRGPLPERNGSQAVSGFRFKDPHPIAKYRVIGPLSNLAAFARTFSCKADAPMVRTGEQRCEVW
jgi:predicted metalloendopeptidase